MGKLIYIKKATISKVLKSQIKSFTETNVFCLLRLGLLLLINKASEIFFLYLLCLYPKLKIVKSSRVTRSWFEFTECWYTCEFLSFPPCSSIRSINLLVSHHCMCRYLSPQGILHYKLSCLCSFFVMSLTLTLELSLVPVQANVALCLSGSILFISLVILQTVFPPLLHLYGSISK